VHLDTTASARKALDMLRKTMAFIELAGVKQCMVVVNIIYKHWIRQCQDSADQIKQKLIENTTRHKDYWELVLRNNSERLRPDYRFVSRCSEMIAFTLFYEAKPKLFLHRRIY
jgi:hypothetical protein